MCQRLKNNVYHEIYTEAIEPLTHHYMNHTHEHEATLERGNTQAKGDHKRGPNHIRPGLR